MAKQKTSIALDVALFSQMRSAVRTATFPTFACGPTTPKSWLRSMGLQNRTSKRSPKSWLRVRHESMKTQCLGNWPMWFQAESQTYSIYKAPTTQWTPPVRLPWRLFWMLADCCKPVRWTSCSQGLQTVRWIRPHFRSSVPLALYHRLIQPHLMPEQTAL